MFSNAVTLGIGLRSLDQVHRRFSQEETPIQVQNPSTIVLGLGFATLIPRHGNAAIVTGDVPGIKLSGMIVDAGPVNSPVLLQLGNAAHRWSPPWWRTADPNDPTLVQDVFFRIGGAEPGKASVSTIR